METYYSLRRFVPDGMRMVIAGGFAAEPRLAGDIDLWMLSDEMPTDDYIIKQRDKCRGLLSGSHSVWWQSPSMYEYADSSKRLVGTVCGPYEGNALLFPNYSTAVYDKKVQLLVTPARTALELVDSFDVSTHAVALQGSTFTFAKAWTSVRETPRVMRWTTPAQTLERLLKVCERYSLQPRREDVERLEYLVECEAVVAGLAEEVAA